MEQRTSRVGKKRILDVAESLFTERGYQAVSIRDIAHECQVTNAALYYHFSNKEALFLEVLAQHAERLKSRMQAAAGGQEDTRAKLVTILNEYVTIVAERRSPLFLLRGSVHGLRNEAFKGRASELMHIMLAPLTEVIETAYAQGELTPPGASIPGAVLLIGMVHGLIQYRKTCQPQRIETADIQAIVDIFWKGMQD